MESKRRIHQLRTRRNKPWYSRAVSTNHSLDFYLCTVLSSTDFHSWTGPSLTVQRCEAEGPALVSSCDDFALRIPWISLSFCLAGAIQQGLWLYKSSSIGRRRCAMANRRMARKDCHLERKSLAGFSIHVLDHYRCPASYT